MCEVGGGKEVVVTQKAVLGTEATISGILTISSSIVGQGIPILLFWGREKGKRSCKLLSSAPLLESTVYLETRISKSSCMQCSKAPG